MSHKSPPDDLKSVMDGIDLRVLSLLDQRMAAALEMGDIKGQPGKEMRDSPGEALVAENLSNRSPRNLVPEEFKEVCSALSRLSGQRRGETKGLNGLLCTTVLESDPEQARHKMRAAAKAGDLVELRLDPLTRIHVHDFLPFSEAPLIMTNRKKEEGGFFEGKEEDRLSYLEEAVRWGATYVDVEWNTPEHLRNRLMDMEGDTQIILSYHDIQGTPPLEDLLSLWQEMSDRGADLVKIVPTATTLEDSLIVLRFLAAVRERGGRVVAHCMGGPGRISRVLSPLFGSPIAYAALGGGEAGAPGQMDPHQMRRVWEALGT